MEPPAKPRDACWVGATPPIKQTTAPSLNLKVRCDLGLQVLSEWASCVQWGDPLSPWPAAPTPTRRRGSPHLHPHSSCFGSVARTEKDAGGAATWRPHEVRQPNPTTEIWALASLLAHHSPCNLHWPGRNRRSRSKDLRGPLSSALWLIFIHTSALRVTFPFQKSSKCK